MEILEQEMGLNIKTLVLTGQGINADSELGWAFELSGATVDHRHVKEVLSNPSILDHYGILAFPGGFSYGDHLGSGRVLAQLLSERLLEPLVDFSRRGLIIGICNGFQVLVKLGLLPMTSGKPIPQASLVSNSGGRFLDAWVNTAAVPSSCCLWTQGMSALDLPIRHGEGRFVADDAVLDRLESGGQVALVYSERNPNGSLRDIAGVCDPTGRIFGLMPHPEAYLENSQHPLRRRDLDAHTGLKIFRNAVDALKR